MKDQLEIRPAFWLVGVFFIALTPNLMHGDALFWEAANAIGFVAFAGLLILLANGYRKAGYSHFHRWVGITVFAAMLLHSLWFLIADEAVLQYVLPAAPVHMVLGISALLISTLLTASSFQRPRKVAYTNAKTFRYWHNWQSIFIVVLSALHISLSGFYFVSPWQWVSLGILTALSFVLPAKPTSSKRGERRQSLREINSLLTLCIIFIVLFLIVRGISQ